MRLPLKWQNRQVMTKDPRKVEVGKRLAEYNRRKREELAKLPVNIMALGPLWLL